MLTHLSTGISTFLLYSHRVCCLSSMLRPVSYHVITSIENGLPLDECGSLCIIDTEVHNMQAAFARVQQQEAENSRLQATAREATKVSLVIILSSDP